MKIASAPRKSPADVVDLLLECHGRIRGFTKLAVDLGGARGAPRDQVADAAGRVQRYFAEALPLHVQDEDTSIAPLLRGRAEAVDDAMAQMTSEHREHEEPLGQLLALCRELRAAPERLPRHAAELEEVARRLEHAFSVHLEREEHVVFPAIRALLAPELQARLFEEVRARRRR